MRGHKLQLIVLGVFVALFLFYPLAHILTFSLHDNGELSFHFFKILATTDTYQDLIIHSLNIALVVTTICSLAAYIVALFLTRFNVPCKKFLTALLITPLIVPPFVGVIGLKQLFGRLGSINLFLLNKNILQDPIDWLGSNGLIGVVALQSVHLMPILFLILRASLLNSHQALEEAALMSGATPLRTLIKITLPLTLPGWFAGASLVFIASFTDLGTPLMFDYREVISVQIFNMLSDINANPVGYSLVVFTCVISIILFTLSRSLFLYGGFVPTDKYSRRASYVPASKATGCLVGGLILTYGFIACLPQLSLILTASSERWFMTVFPEKLTIDNFLLVFSHPLTARSIAISILLSILATFLTVVLGFTSAHIIARGSPVISSVVESISLVPLAIPGLVFAFGFIGAFAGTIIDNRVNPLPLLVFAYTIRRLPTLVRTTTAGFQEANKSLEDAAYTVGAGRYQTMRQIVFPLVKGHLYAGALLTFAYSMIEVSDSLFLALEEKYYPIAKAMYALIGRPDGIELASALGVIVMATLGIIFYFSQKLTGSNLKTLSLTIGVLAVTSPHSPASADELVLLSPHWEGIRHEFSEAFARSWKQKTGKGVHFRWLDVGGTSDIVKYVKSEFKRNPNSIGVDIFFGGGIDSFLELERFGLLTPANIDKNILQEIPADIAGSPLYSRSHLWFANSMSTFGILCNLDALKLLRKPVPRTWRDLARPVYHSYISAGDPRKSGSMHAMYEIILQGYGWEEGWQIIYRIARNTRRFTNNASQVGKEITTGEALCGIVIDTYANETAKRVGESHVSFILPEDFVSVNGDGAAILRGAPNNEVAQAFAEFLLTKEAQNLWYGKKGIDGGPRKYEIGKLSVLPSIYDTVIPASLFRSNPFRLPNILSYNASLASSRWNILNDLFGAFIVDPHTDLKTLPLNKVPNEPPISEEMVRTLQTTTPWGDNQSLRAHTLAEWSTRAQRLTSEPSSKSKVSRLFLLILLIVLTLTWGSRRLR